MTRIALVSNCLINQNAKVAEFEVCPGALSPLLQLLRTNGFHIQQMPCPELTFMGCGRWWQVKAQYDTPGYRRHCRLLANSVADILGAANAEACTDLVFLGVDGSPSSAVGITDHGPSWGGRPEARDVSHTAGKGVWTEVLLEVFRERGMPMPRLIGIGTELPGYNEKAELMRLLSFLDAPELVEAPVTMPPARMNTPFNDANIERSRRVLVVSEASLNDGDACAAFEATGWGLLQMPPTALPPVAYALAVELVADQIVDFRHHGYSTAALAGAGIADLDADLERRGQKKLKQISQMDLVGGSP